MAHCGIGNRASLCLQRVLYIVESRWDKKWARITYLIPVATAAVLVFVVAEHAKASLMHRIATMLVAVDDRPHYLKTRKATLEIVASVGWNHLVAGQAADSVASAGDIFLVSGHPDVEGMWLTTVDCTRQNVILQSLLRMMGIQRTMRREMVGVDWGQPRRGNCKAIDVRFGHFGGSCSEGGQR